MFTPLVQSLAHTLAPWQSLYSDSKAVSMSVTTVHLVAMLFGGGYAVAADRAVLRCHPSKPIDARRILNELHGLHRPVIIALAFMALTGFAMAAADVETFATSPIFAVKLGIVVLLLINGLVLQRSERSLARLISGPPLVLETELAYNGKLWRHLRRTSWTSASLWTAAVVIGVMLTNA